MVHGRANHVLKTGQGNQNRFKILMLSKCWNDRIIYYEIDDPKWFAFGKAEDLSMSFPVQPGVADSVQVQY